MRLHVYSLAINKPFPQWWTRYARASVLWPRNAAALAGCETLFDIYCDVDFEAQVGEHLKGWQYRTTKIPHGTAYLMKRDTLAAALETAVARDAALLFLPADLVFGDGSVGALLRMLSVAKDRCIAAPHARVSSGAFEAAWTGEPMDNPTLVRRAMATLYKQAVACKLPAGRGANFACGFSWSELAQDMYAVTSHLPSVHVLKPTVADVEFIRTSKRGAWDHEWPSGLIEADRLRVIGSSDAAFMAELSSDAKAFVADALDADYPDKYRNALPHNVVCRSTVSVWRAAA